MTAIQEAKSLLADSEKALRDLMQRELKAQRYAELGELAGIADGLARLARSGTVSTPRQPSLAKPPEAAIARPARKAIPKRKSSAKGEYPRFERDDDKLVKIGWSKKAREEYEHRAPRTAVLAFAEHVGSTTAAGKTFVIDDLLPVHDPTGEVLPSYQVYLALAWLRQARAVEKKGRDGYVRVADPLDGSVFDALWDQVHERS